MEIWRAHYDKLSNEEFTGTKSVWWASMVSLVKRYQQGKLGLQFFNRAKIEKNFQGGSNYPKGGRIFILFLENIKYRVTKC